MMTLKYIVQESDNSYILRIYLKKWNLPGYCVNTQEKGNELEIPGFITKTMLAMHTRSYSTLIYITICKNGRQDVKTWFLSWLCGEVITLKGENLQIFKWHTLQSFCVCDFRWVHLLWISLGHRKTTCVSVVFIIGCKGISASESGPPLPGFHSFGFLQGCFSHIVSLFCNTFCAVFFYHFLDKLSPNSDRETTNVFDGLSFGQWWVLKAAWNCSVHHGGSFWHLLETTSAAHPLPKPCQASPV